MAVISGKNVIYPQAGYIPLVDREQLQGPPRNIKNDQDAYFLGQVSGYKERATIDLVLPKATWVRQKVIDAGTQR